MNGMARRSAASVSLRCSSEPMTLTQTGAWARSGAGFDVGDGHEADARVGHLALQRLADLLAQKLVDLLGSLGHRDQRSLRAINRPPGSPFAG